MWNYYLFPVTPQKTIMLGFAGQKLVSIAIVVAVVYLLLVILMLLLQSKFLFFPSKDLDYTPGQLGMAFEDVYFSSSDGTGLHGWFIPAESRIGTLLFCHGNAGNISHRIESVRIFHDLGFDVLIFDYRGYGQSSGSISEKGTYSDAEAALKHLVEVKNIDQSEIIYFGRSLGGSIAAWLAKEHTPGGLIVESAFTSVNDIAGDVYPFLPVRMISRFKFNTREYLQNVNCPVLVIHSREDELINFKHGRKLFETAGEPKMFLELAGSHNEGFFLSGQHYINGLKDFFDQHVNMEK